MLGRILLNGSNKKWIFKNGKFYITPLENSWSINNGILKSNGKLVIPYDTKNENIFIKYNIPYSTDFGFCFSTRLSSYTGATNYKQDGTITLRHEGKSSSNILGMESDKFILCETFYGGGNIEIIEIWTEKIGGGGAITPYIKSGIAYLGKAVSTMLGRVWGVGSKSFFPTGYKYVNSGTFPGLSDKVIPILVSWSCSCSGTGGGWSSGGSYCYYDKGTKYYKIGSVSARSSATQAYGYGNAEGVAFLPHYFNYNWELMKTISNAGGTVIAWLEKVGA